MKYPYARPILRRQEHKAMMCICDFYRNPQNELSVLHFKVFHNHFGGDPNTAESILRHLATRKLITYRRSSSSTFKEIYLTESGELYPENEYAAHRKKLKDEIRYWLTTAIAVAALIISIHEIFF